jgi:hypothetical protein
MLLPMPQGTEDVTPGCPVGAKAGRKGLEGPLGLLLFPLLIREGRKVEGEGSENWQ